MLEAQAEPQDVLRSREPSDVLEPEAPPAEPVIGVSVAPGVARLRVGVVLLTVGFFCVTQLEFNQTSIAAILTIVGYSLNETVVVLDRIREVMRKYKRLSTAEIIDMSINAVLPRTIMTATTVFLALLALFFLGGHVIRSFSAAMIWGIFVATYSSIFICSPMLIYMGVRADAFDRMREKEVAGADVKVKGAKAKEKA